MPELAPMTPGNDEQVVLLSVGELHDAEIIAVDPGTGGKSIRIGFGNIYFVDEHFEEHYLPDAVVWLELDALSEEHLPKLQEFKGSGVSRVSLNNTEVIIVTDRGTIDIGAKLASISWTGFPGQSR